MVVLDTPITRTCADADDDRWTLVGYDVVWEGEFGGMTSASVG